MNTFHVLCCPGRTPTVQGGVQIWDTKLEGHFPTYVRAIRQALHDNRGPITILEDDTEITAGWWDYVQHFYEFVQRTGQVVQWFCNGRMYIPGSAQGWTFSTSLGYFIHRPGGKFLSTQAVTYSRGVAFLLLSELEHMLADAPKDDLGRRHSGDAAIGRVFYNQKQDFLVHWPPVAQHVGANSMIAPGMALEDGFRTNPHYSRNTAQQLFKTRPSPLVLYPGEYDER
jgi:hypothetical protein